MARSVAVPYHPIRFNRNQISDVSTTADTNVDQVDGWMLYSVTRMNQRFDTSLSQLHVTSLISSNTCRAMSVRFLLILPDNVNANL